MPSQQSKPLAWIVPERNSPVPLQTQIARWLEQLIVSGSLAAGDRLPAEASLVERLGVSRVTVRLAMDDLVSRGLITRSHGKGSFVSPAMVRHDILSDQGFFDILLAKAVKPQVRLLAFEPAVPPAEVAELFKLAPGQKAMKLDRLSLSAGGPSCSRRIGLHPMRRRCRRPTSRASRRSRCTACCCAIRSRRP